MRSAPVPCPWPIGNSYAEGSPCRASDLGRTLRHTPKSIAVNIEPLFIDLHCFDHASHRVVEGFDSCSAMPLCATRNKFIGAFLVALLDASL